MTSAGPKAFFSASYSIILRGSGPREPRQTGTTSRGLH